MFNKTSDLLLKKTDEIMKLWEQRVSEEISASYDLESLALRNSIPEYLAHLASALSHRVNRTEARKLWDKTESTRVGKLHGKERASSLNYTMDQLIFEYHILRQVIFDVLEKDEDLESTEREVIICSVEQAVNDAATEFSDTLRDLQEQLSHTLAHDLRTPITAAKTSAQLILRRPDDVNHCINKASRISTNMDRIDNMIRDLLDASQIRAGQVLTLEFEDCDLDWIISVIADELNATFEGRVKIISDGTCVGLWNKNGLRRMVENLTNNAIKYGSKDTPVTLTLTQDDQSATLKVHNGGKPIPPEDRSILFKKYRRARTAGKEVGWGLGLTVVKGMVDAHQGSIDVISEEGLGTTFIVTLPKNRVNDDSKS